jgi:type III pantothenate kinase
MILVVDAGNTRVKWGLHDGVSWWRKGWAPCGELAQLDSQWPPDGAPQRILVSCVAGADLSQQLRVLFSRWNVEVEWITAQAFQCGVTNGYRNPAQLGCDRWAALMAAWRRAGRACVVVNAGTALTVDALDSSGFFCGGLIVPGLSAMQRALAANTAALTVAAGRFEDFPVCTADAIYSGALSAMAGAVERALVALAARTGAAPDCLVSGGDAVLLGERLSVPASIVDNLVLDGLIEMTR